LCSAGTNSNLRLHIVIVPYIFHGFTHPLRANVRSTKRSRPFFQMWTVCSWSCVRINYCSWNSIVNLIIDYLNIFVCTQINKCSCVCVTQYLGGAAKETSRRSLRLCVARKICLINRGTVWFEPTESLMLASWRSWLQSLFCSHVLGE
jgi:hypothetical protein